MENGQITRRGFLAGSAIMGTALASGAFAQLASASETGSGSTSASASGSAAASANASASASGSASASASASGSAAASSASTLPEDGISTASDWLGEEPTIDESQITDTKECDVLVVGAGHSGLFAACSAAENGASVIAIEKNDAGAGIRGTVAAVGTRYQTEAGIELDPNAVCNELEKYSASYVNPKLHHLWANESAEAIEWYADLCEAAGATFMVNSDLDLTEAEQSAAAYRHWATGHSCIIDGRTSETPDVMTNYADQLGVQFLYDTPMVKLEKSGDKVTGVIAASADGSYLRINASKGVIVCTGGYAQNGTMMKALQPNTVLTYSSIAGFAGVEGDGIKACLWAGASLDAVHTSQLFDRCPLLPDETAGQKMCGDMFWMGTQPWLKVNLAGERFCNECAPYDFILHASIDQPGHTYCTIWDSNYVDYVYQFRTQGCSRMFPFDNDCPVSAISLDVAQQMNEGLMKEGKIQQADTIEELAQKLNIPADAFAATVDRYNGLVASGVDSDFGKESFRLSPVDTAPFFGVRQTGILMCTMDGIRIDTNMNAVDGDDKSIAGLYVCGNDSGSFFANTYPDVMAGLTAGRSLTFARRAGRIAATGE